MRSLTMKPCACCGPCKSPTFRHQRPGRSSGFQIPIAYELTDLAASDQAFTQAVKTRVLQHREYPAEAIPSKLEGNTVLDATVGPDGSLQDLRVYQPSGSEILDQAAKTLLERSAPFPMQHWQ